MKGDRAASSSLPAGTVTFLFSDIEGSTNLARTLGAEWSAVLRLHRDLLRAAFDARGGELDDGQRAHAGYFLALATEARDEVEGPSGPEWLGRLDRESGNLRAALEWALAHDPAAAMDAAADLWRYWQRRGHLGEGRMWLERAVAGSEAAPARPGARAFGALGSIAYWQNDFVRTRSAYEASLAAWRGTDDQAGLSEALYNLGFMDLVEHRFDGARAAYAESLTLAEGLGDQGAIGRLSFGLGMVAMVAGELDEARRRFEESIPILEASGNQYLTLSARRDLVEVARRSGELARARDMNREVLAEVHGMHDPMQFAMSLEDLASIEAQEGRLARALRIAGAAAGVKERAGGGAPPPLVSVLDVRAEAAGHLDAGEIERLWREGQTLDDDAAYALASAPEEPARQRK